MRTAKLNKLNILVGRRYFGFGDWLMTCSAIKQLHTQCPDVQVHVEVGNIDGR